MQNEMQSVVMGSCNFKFPIWGRCSTRVASSVRRPRQRMPARIRRATVLRNLFLHHNVTFSMVDHQTSLDAAMQQQQSRLLANEDISLGQCYNVLGICGGGKSIDQNLQREMTNKLKREEAKENSPSQMQNNSPTAETMPRQIRRLRRGMHHHRHTRRKGGALTRIGSWRSSLRRRSR
jgi:hypothetical protein